MATSLGVEIAMTQVNYWRPADNPGRFGGFGFVVERDGQLGFAKANSIKREKLAADLAQLTGAPVPRVEIGKVEGSSDLFAISYMHSDNSRALVKKGELPRDYSPEERLALRAASGLLPFLIWIGAEDHYNDTNLVRDTEGHSYRIVAIDFEHAFRWDMGEDRIVLDTPPGLVANVDPLRVEQRLVAIEGLNAAQITGCSTDAFIEDSALGTRIANVLIRRQRTLRTPFRERGWLG
jgi:hypothetical protein